MNEMEKLGMKPSKIVITEMLAAIESTRKHATKRWQVALILPLVAGAALIGYTAYEVRKNLKQRDELVAEQTTLKEEIDTLEVRRAELTKENSELALTVNKIETVVQEAKTQGNDVNWVERNVLRIVGSSPTIEKATPTVIICINDENQRAKARQVTQALKSLGYTVPAIEVRPTKIDGNEVRFFRQEDRDIAEKVAGVLAEQGVKAKLVLLRRPKARPAQIEIWFQAPAASVVKTDEERIESERRNDVAIIRLQGPLTADSGRELRSTVNLFRAKGYHKFLIDLGNVSKMDEEGLKALVSEHTAIHRAGGQLRVMNLHKGLTDQVTLARLLTVFENYTSEAEAIKSFNE